uniref:Mannosyltransferase n=1 Tax=Rhizochromulina marina TaxID=1034831 RepID=A0A7S2RN23_9STRA|mmetsp:Transcript_18635/g.54301  ORF Transcript_18635/g.54301 Transcript_18635/m.54301 type:complete len:322 (+) Transcript_18635:291-1256(+)
MLVDATLPSFFRAVGTGILCGVGVLAVTIPVDSFFWQRLLWPEGQVLFFNTVQNRSSEWGVSPFHWYFTSAIPRALALSGTLLVPAVLRGSPRHWDLRRLNTIVDSTVLPALLPALLFVGILSILPHKELRFIFPALPLLNVCIAHGLAKLSRSAGKRPVVFVVAGIAPLAATLLFTLLVAFISGKNYPGGHALVQAHQLLDHVPRASVHIDVAAAMSGVSRFGELRRASGWTYSKDESLVQPEDFSKFDVLVTGDPAPYLRLSTFHTIHEEHGYAGLTFRGVKGLFELAPLEVKTDPKIFVLVSDRLESEPRSPAPGRVN